MKVTTKLATGMLLCAGLVQVASPKTMHIRLILENPKAHYQYAQGNGNAEPVAKAYKAIPGNKNGAQLSFDDVVNYSYDAVNEPYVYVKKANSSDKPKALKLEDKGAQSMGSNGLDMILVSATGSVRYENNRIAQDLREKFEDKSTSKKSTSKKSKSKKSTY